MKSSMNLSSRNRQEHQNKMDKQQSSTGICRNIYWLVIFASFGLWFFLFCFNSSIYISGKDKIHSFMTDYVYPVMSSSSSSQSNPVLNETQTHSSTTNPIKPIIDWVDPEENSQQEPLNVEIEDDPCSNKYIYVHNLPPRFNHDLIKQCKTLYLWSDLCPFMMNSGLGPIMENSDGVFSDKGWFATNQFTLEVIFHNKMKNYKCLTNNSSLASAIFVPFYSGLDIFRYLWGFNSTMKDLVSLDLMKWLKDRPEWEVLDGRDHFLIAGRITWDYRRVTDDDSDWGNKLMVLPEARNMSVLTIEASPWHRNDFAIPYPTYFHPSSDNEVYEWQNRMRRHKKRYLFSFAGAPRPNITGSIRNDIINQCVESNKTCEFLDCRKGTCELPSKVMKLFQDSFFCLQPPGDSSTRRSAFDSILAGCIPVFFHPGSAYTQYMWHLPKDYKKYSVFISEYDVRKGNVSIESVLKQIPEEKVRAMREEVIKLIPKMVYADPRSKLENTEDAFDIAVNGVLERVKKVRKDMSEGRNPDEPPYLEDNTWKYTLFGTEKKHEWDIFFDTRRN